MLTALLVFTTVGAAKLDAGTMSSIWLADVRHSASHDVPSYGNTNGVYMMQTFVMVLDKWVTERVAIGWAMTFAYQMQQKAPTMGVMELRLSGRVPLNERMFLVGVASLGYPVIKEYRPSYPSAGADVGFGVRVAPHLSLRADVGLFYARFGSIGLEATNDREIVDVTRRVSFTAARFTAGIAADF